MKILVLDGNTEMNRISLDILESFRVISEHNSFDLEVVNLQELEISYCRGCFNCWIKTPGECIIDDDARDICARIIQSDVVVYLTPITYGAYSPTLKVLLDRSIPLIHPFFEKIDGEYHHRKRYDRYPSIYGIGLLESEDPELEELFRKNVTRNALNMHAPSIHCDIYYSKTSTSGFHQQIERHLSGMEVIA